MTEHESREALRCEKCGGTDVYTRYRAAGETLDDGFGTARSYFDKIKEECLRRVCRTCGWKWVDPIVAPVVGEREAEHQRAIRGFDDDGEPVCICGLTFWSDDVCVDCGDTENAAYSRMARRRALAARTPEEER